MGQIWCATFHTSHIHTFELEISSYQDKPKTDTKANQSIFCSIRENETVKEFRCFWFLRSTIVRHDIIKVKRQGFERKERRSKNIIIFNIVGEWMEIGCFAKWYGFLALLKDAMCFATSQKNWNPYKWHHWWLRSITALGNSINRSTTLYNAIINGKSYWKTEHELPASDIDRFRPLFEAKIFIKTLMIFFKMTL